MTESLQEQRDKRKADIIARYFPMTDYVETPQTIRIKNMVADMLLDYIQSCDAVREQIAKASSEQNKK